MKCKAIENLKRIFFWSCKKMLLKTLAIKITQREDVKDIILKSYRRCKLEAIGNTNAKLLKHVIEGYRRCTILDIGNARWRKLENMSFLLLKYRIALSEYDRIVIK